MQYLIKAIKGGDVDAFGTFFRNHYSRLLSYSHLFIKDISLAEDIVQETFINFWEKRETLSPGKSPESLLFISLRNRCLNVLRDQKKTSQRLDELKFHNQTLQFISQIDYLGQEELPLEEQLIHELNKAIEELPERCRQVVKLSKIEGLKNREVALKLGISVKAVERQLAIGKSKIEAHIRKLFPIGMILFLCWFR
jgi:RNA polymerase sigma-70 factor (ECF subfamily)